MKKYSLTLIVFLLFIGNTQAQKTIVVKESSTPLTKTSLKGFLYDTHFDADKLEVYFKTPAKKKSPETIYESYAFDEDLAFKGTSTVSVPKKEKEMPTREMSSIYAYVGGLTSFDVLSMKLKMEYNTWTEEWDTKKQRYVVAKGSSKSEKIKPKKDLERYYGHAAYYNSNNKSNSILIVASYKSENKKDGELYSLLKVNSSGDINDVNITSQPGYSLVKCGKLNTDEIFVILAPKEGNNYIIAQYDLEGKEIFNKTFKAPSSNLLVTEYFQKDGILYLFGISKNNTDSYKKVFEDYAPIYGVGYTGSANYQQDKFEKKMYGVSSGSFHLLKFKEGNMQWESSSSVKDLSSKVKTSPSQKKKKAYKGQPLAIEDFLIAPNGDFIVVGQTTQRKIVKTSNAGSLGEYTPMRVYMDVICFHFDKDGKLKAQYAVDKIINDKASTTIPLRHNFFLSADNSVLYWEIQEVKVVKGYSNFWDAFAGIQTLYPNFFPRMGQINLNSAEIYDFKHIGGKKSGFLMRGETYDAYWDNQNKIRYYVGHDGKNKSLVLGKIQLQ